VRKNLHQVRLPSLACENSGRTAASWHVWGPIVSQSGINSRGIFPTLEHTSTARRCYSEGRVNIRDYTKPHPGRGIGTKVVVAICCPLEKVIREKSFRRGRRLQRCLGKSSKEGSLDRGPTNGGEKFKKRKRKVHMRV